MRHAAAPKIGALFLIAATLAHPGRAMALPLEDSSSEAPMNTTDEMRAAADGIEQALPRFAAGQDLKDPDLLGRAFSEDARLDFTQPAAELGAQAAVMQGRKQIVETITAATAPLTTSHTITNVRVIRLSDAGAEAHALIEAMHVDRKMPARRLLLKHSLKVTASRSGQQWQIGSLEFHNLWREGDPKVLFPGATGGVVGEPAYQGPVSIILYEPGPAWKRGRPLAEQGLETHGRYLAQLTRDGKLLSAGPLASGGGLVIVAGSPPEAQAVMQSDPAVRDRKFIGTVTQWTPMMGWMKSSPARPATD